MNALRKKLTTSIRLLSPMKSQHTESDSGSNVVAEQKSGSFNFSGEEYDELANATETAQFLPSVQNVNHSSRESVDGKYRGIKIVDVLGHERLRKAFFSFVKEHASDSRNAGKLILYF